MVKSPMQSSLGNSGPSAARRKGEHAKDNGLAARSWNSPSQMVGEAASEAVVIPGVVHRQEHVSLPGRQATYGTKYDHGMCKANAVLAVVIGIRAKGNTLRH